MGINLSPLLKTYVKTVPLSSLSHRTLAVDALNLFYRYHALSEKKSPCEAITAFVHKNAALFRENIKLVYVIEQCGSPLGNFIGYCSSLVSHMGCPIVHTLGEGEAQAAYLTLKGSVYATLSSDYDSLLYGAKRTVLGIRGRMASLITLGKVLSGLGITRDQLIDMAILMGTDAHRGVSGIGARKALALIKRYGSAETINKKWARVGGRVVRLPKETIRVVRQGFREPRVSRGRVDLGWSSPRRGDIASIFEEVCGSFTNHARKAVYELVRTRPSKAFPIDFFSG